MGQKVLGRGDARGDASGYAGIRGMRVHAAWSSLTTGFDGHHPAEMAAAGYMGRFYGRRRGEPNDQLGRSPPRTAQLRRYAAHRLDVGHQHPAASDPAEPEDGACARLEAMA